NIQRVQASSRPHKCFIKRSTSCMISVFKNTRSKIRQVFVFLKRAIMKLTQVAEFTTTILLTGETGVGKSIVAKEIHNLSNRSEGPFIQINCGAIPESLLESELFGYKKGAFTGANAKGKTGLVEKAAGGTLFLDEIAELPLALQPKILQLAQDKSFIPVGG